MDLFSVLRLRSIDIKVLWTFSPCCGCDSIDIKVFQTFSRCSRGRILSILCILAILLQTAEGSRGTGPRATVSFPFIVGRGPVPRQRCAVRNRAYGIVGVCAVRNRAYGVCGVGALCKRAASCPSCSSCPSCFRQLKAREGQALALRIAGPFRKKS